MKQIMTPEYRTFRCIAGACPDSCCTDWEIVLDEKTEAFYRTIPGELGKRLRKTMIFDADGDVIFQEKDSRCPFWNAQHLCDIQMQLGETALCETCRQFPRLVQDYGDFAEYDLSIACPEAARILLTMPLDTWSLTEENHPELPGDAPEYDPIRMSQLQRQRSQLFKTLRDTSRPALVQMAECLSMQLDWEQIAHPQMQKDVVCSENVCLEFLRSCEILTPDWRHMLERAVLVPTYALEMNEAFDREIRLFAIDVLYRHYLRTVFDDSSLFPVQLAAFFVCAVCTMIHRLDIRTQPERLRIWQLFVKEVEYDGDNMKRLELLLETKQDLSPNALYARLYAENVDPSQKN